MKVGIVLALQYVGSPYLTDGNVKKCLVKSEYIYASTAVCFGDLFRLGCCYVYLWYAWRLLFLFLSAYHGRETAQTPAQGA